MTDRAQVYANPRIGQNENAGNAVRGSVHADPLKIAWAGSMFLFGTVGSAFTYTHSALALFVVFTGVTLCLGHSLGMHRRFIHRAYECPRWLEYLFVHYDPIMKRPLIRQLPAEFADRRSALAR